MQKTAVGYVRVSTDEQHLGPQAQVAALRDWAERAGVELLEVHEDIGVSGALPVDRRPGLLAALHKLRTENAGFLVVEERDRIARDLVVSAMVQRLVEKASAELVSADGIGNGSGPEDFLLRGIMDVFAAYERMLIRSRTAQALAVKKAAGERVGSIPYGFRLAGDGVTLVKDPVEQKTVRAVIRLRKKGLSLRKVAARLDDLGYRSRGGGSWHPQTVANILARQP